MALTVRRLRRQRTPRRTFFIATSLLIALIVPSRDSGGLFAFEPGRLVQPPSSTATRLYHGCWSGSSPRRAGGYASGRGISWSGDRIA